jgi:hypothetical protein
MPMGAPGGLERASFWLAVLCGGRQRGRARIAESVRTRFPTAGYTTFT